MSDNEAVTSGRDLPDSRWWRLAEIAAWHGSPRLGRLSAKRPAGFAAGFGVLVAVAFYIDGTGWVAAMTAFAVMFALIAGNGLFLRSYLRRGGTFSDGRGIE